MKLFEKTLKKILILGLALLMLGGCSRDAATSTPAENSGKQTAAQTVPAPIGFRSVTAQEAAKLVNSRPDLLILDVRTPQELQNGAIQGSILTPFWTLVQGTAKLDPKQPLLLVCAVGGRSYAAGQVLVRKGFQEVYNLAGGMNAWKQAGLPVVYKTAGN